MGNMSYIVAVKLAQQRAEQQNRPEIADMWRLFFDRMPIIHRSGEI